MQADQAVLDEKVPQALQLFTQQFTTFIGVTVTISTVSPLMIGCLVVLAIPYFYLARRYQLPARDLRRIESVQRSPVLSLFAESVKGVLTIQAFGCGASFLRAIQTG